MKVFKGMHYGFPYWPRLYLNKEYKESINIIFTESCKYQLPGEDQHDINKLFGIGYGHHHTDSDRIGWRWNSEKEMIELVNYSYQNKRRMPSKTLMWVKIGEKVTIDLESYWSDSHKRSVCFSATKEKESNILYRNYTVRCINFAYNLGLYFGGNQKAPHTITINKI